MRLILVRHAETEASARGRCYGSLDVGLSPLGRRQCAGLARALAVESVAAVVASPRVRAVETATPVAERHGLAVRVEPSLAELDFGELEGRSYDEIAASLPELYAAWMMQPTKVRFPGGESYADLEARTLHAVRAMLAAFDGRTVVVVTHGGVIRAVLSHVLGVPADRIFRITVDPASRSVVEWVGGEPVVLVVNERTKGAPA